MAALTGKTRCVTCRKEKFVYKCEGCSENFCASHLADHHQAFSEQLDKIEDEHNSFRKTLTEKTTNTQKHPLTQKIDQWEHDSINKIKQTADQARQLIIKHTSEHSATIEIKSAELAEQIKQTREKDFNEIRLNQLKIKLKELRDELGKPSTISIEQDSSSFINKMFVVISSNTSHQRSTEEASTTNTGSTFSSPFLQILKSGSPPQFQFTNQLPTTSSPVFFHNPTSINPPCFSFGSLSTANAQEFSHPTTSIYEQTNANKQEQEETDTSSSKAERLLKEKEINTTLQDPTKVVVDRSDPNPSLCSVTSFKDFNLKPDLLRGIYSMGFWSPSKIQSIVLPQLLGNPPKNIIVQSQYGTGKTVALSIAITSRIDPSIQSPQALILAPTYELAIHIGSVLERMTQSLPYIRVAYAVRDPTISKRNERTRGQLVPEQIVIGTPGTVDDWCRKLRIINLSKLLMCCVDHTNFMIATGSFQASTCVELLQRLDISYCQIMVFSATYSDEVMQFARQIVPNPVVLRLKREKQMLENIKQFFIRCYETEHKYCAIEEIYKNLTVAQAMIFCRTKATARHLAIRMTNQNYRVQELTSALDIEQCAAIIKQFREGIFRVLISTGVVVHGVSVDDVSLVIHYDMPVTEGFKPDYETYLYQIGRCGRFGRLGYAFNLIGSEKDFNIMKEFETYFSHTIDEITLEGIAHLEEDQE